MNTIIIIGNLGADPEVKTSANGTKYARLRVATTEGSGDRKLTSWHNVTVWQQTAEFVEKYCKKGDRIAVTGKLHYSEWDKDGQKHRDAVIDSREVELLTPKGKPSVDAEETAQQVGGDGLPF